jgi:hypothetical protein
VLDSENYGFASCNNLLDWPEALLSHEKAGTVYRSSGDSSRMGLLLFRGLKVRVAISTGKLLFQRLCSVVAC